MCVFTLRALPVSPGDFADLLEVGGDFFCALVDTCGVLKLPAFPARPKPAREFSEGTLSWHLRAVV